MKNRILSIGYILLLCGSVIAFLAFSRNVFEGNKIKTSDEYALYIVDMNGRDAHKMNLKEGDVLCVYFRKESGELSLSIKDESGENVYTGGGTVVNEFTIDIKRTDEYLFEVEAKKAKGAISIRKNNQIS